MVTNSQYFNSGNSKILTGINTLLKGISQIMLQENSWTGLLFILGLVWGSISFGLAILFATFCGTTTAHFLKYEKKKIRQGIYGFSAALVGVALALFLEPVWQMWLLIAIGSAVATIIQHFFAVRKIPVFTLPFVLVTWCILGLIHLFFPELYTESSPPITNHLDSYFFLFKGYGQVIFQGSLWAGILFFIGVLVSSPVAGIFGLVGGIISSLIAIGFGANLEDVYAGLFGYNAVLCAIVFAGTKISDGLWAMLAIVFALLVQYLLNQYAIPVLTFPFVAGTCAALIIKNNIRRLSRTC